MQTQISLTDFQNAARTYQKELALMPFFACEDVLKYMRGLPGIRYQHAIGSAEANSQFAPYKADRKGNSSLDINYRILETFMGNVVEDFEPNEVITTILGKGASFLGEGQKNAPIAKLVLASVMASLGEHLHDVLFTAKRNANGNTTADLFDGWATIAQKEIADGNISEQKGNFLRIGEAVTDANAVDIAKEILRSLDPRLRRQDLFLYCPLSFADAYNEAYLTSHAGLVYNTKYNQVSVEGSNGRLTIVPLAPMEGTEMMFVSNKNNMIYGYDAATDISRIQVDRFSPFILTLSAAMFMGTQFESIDSRRLKVIGLADGSPKAPKISQSSNKVTITGKDGDTLKYKVGDGDWTTYSSAITATASNAGKVICAKAVKDGKESDIVFDTIQYTAD